MKRDAFQTVVDSILAKLDTCGTWERPWTASAAMTMPTNATTGRKYRGSNVVMLWIAAQDAGYSDSRWATFKQWADAGAKVRKGEHGTPVLWFQMIERKGDKTAPKSDSEDEASLIPCARVSFVFNAAQVDGLALDAASAKPSAVESVAAADALVRASGATIHHGSAQAFYRRSTDQIHMPAREAFAGTSTSTATETYYATLLHELTHWTAPRLDRQFGKRFGDAAYAAEELVAELGAAFLCAELGIASTPREDHAAYIAHWSKLLRDDPRAFTTAAAKAAQACDYLLNGQPVALAVAA